MSDLPLALRRLPAPQRSRAAIPVKSRIGPRPAQGNTGRAAARGGENRPAPVRRPPSGCFSNASSGTGANFSAAASARRQRKAPGGVLASGRPAESSISMFQRRISAATRRARLRSGVTSAAVRPLESSSSAWRSISAIDAASSPGCAASTSDNPARPSAMSPPPRSARARQASVVGAGRSTSRTSVSRAAFAGGGVELCDLARAPHRIRSKQLLQSILRMTGIEIVPAGVVQVLVEPGQHDETVRQIGDGLQQLRRGRDAAG